MKPETLLTRPPQAGDATEFEAAFKRMGWQKPASLFIEYRREYELGRRWVRVAEWESAIAGYITVLWESEDPAFRSLGVPEIVDLNVLSEFRRRGVGQALLTEAENVVRDRSDLVGIRVGLHSGYGVAQRLYVRNGYEPDGAGAVIKGDVVKEGAAVRLDDDVTLRLLKRLDR